LYVGRLIPRKQIDVVIRSLVELKKCLTDKTVMFRIIGIGWQQTALEELVNELHLEENVVFAGEVSYNVIQQEYQSSDIYIQLSKTEGMSNSILEAMSCGLPVITTNVGGASEFMENNGFIITPTIEAVVESVRAYTENHALLDKHGQQSRLLAGKFSLEQASQQYLAMFRSRLQDALL
jgi:glycosyltransferase involved in cell wall biosynthesis